MAIKFNRSQTFATNGTVTAAALHNLIDGTDIYQALITDQTAMTSVGSLDKLLIADSDLTAADAPRSVTVNELFEDALTLSTYTNVNATNLKYTSATGNYTLSTGATITNGTIASGIITSLTAGTTISTAATITTGTIPTLTSITKITSGTGTVASPAISPTGDTNTGIFFPATDTLALGTNGTETMRISASGNVGIGNTSPSFKFEVVGGRSVFSAASEQYAVGAKHISTGGAVYFGAASGSATPDAVISAAGGSALMTIQNGGNVGIGTTSPSRQLSVSGASAAFGITSTAAGGNTVSIDPATTASSNIAQIDCSGANALRFNTNGTEQLRIASAGQIGIGGANYGTTGQVLTSNGTAAAPSWQAGAGITRGTAVASTSGTAIDFTGIPSTAKRITVMLSNVSTDGGSLLRMQLGVGGVATTTGYLGSSFASTGAGVANATFSSGVDFADASADGDRKHGNIVFTSVTGNTWSFTGMINLSNTARCSYLSGSVPLGGTLNMVRVTTVNGTDAFDFGTINIMYEG